MQSQECRKWHPIASSSIISLGLRHFNLLLLMLTSVRIIQTLSFVRRRESGYEGWPKIICRIRLRNLPTLSNIVLSMLLLSQPGSKDCLCHFDVQQLCSSRSPCRRLWSSSFGWMHMPLDLQLRVCWKFFLQMIVRKILNRWTQDVSAWLSQHSAITEQVHQVVLEEATTLLIILRQIVRNAWITGCMTWALVALVLKGGHGAILRQQKRHL